MLIAGVLDVIYGFAAIGDANFWVNEQHLVFGNLHTWGWITVIIGVVEIFARISLFAGGTFGRVIGIIAASIGAVGSLLGSILSFHTHGCEELESTRPRATTV